MISKIKSLQNHQGFMKYFKNTSWLFGEKILRMFVGLFVGIWVARYLGPEQFGLFSYAQSFVGLFTAIATLGLDGIVVRELVKDESRRDELIGTAFWLKLIGAFGVLLILAIAVNFTSNDTYTNTLVFIIASATIFQSFNVVDMYFQSKVMGKYIVYANVISLLLSSIVKIALILNEASLEAFVWTIVFDSVVLAIGYVYFFLKNSKFKIQNLIFDKSTAITLLKDSWPLIFSGIIIGIYMRIDQVMIQQMMNNESAGYFAAALRISSVWYVVPSVLVASLFPAIINAHKTNQKLYIDRLQKLYDLMIWSGLLVCCFITLFASDIIYLLYGNEYGQASGVLVIHVWTILIMNFGIVWSRWLILENMQKFGLYGDIFSLIVNIVLNFYLINLFGIQGAAFATLISYLITPLFVFIFYRNTLSFNMLLNSFNVIRIFKKGAK
ncbi:flippase [Aliarcobacter cryaerophilus]|uniref:flippase n=1 Tax=Aliarcobacter cryaerophilus TaxID=28198 RepID=UPI003DA4F977